MTLPGALRVHLGYVAAPGEVLAAFARWADPKTHRAARLLAQRILTAFPVHEQIPPEVLPTPRPPEPQPGDEGILARLHELHRAITTLHFEGILGRVRMALSARRRRRLGEFRLSADGGHEIVIARRHLRRDGWAGVSETLAHEMGRQGRAETGRRPGLGAEFRKMWAMLQSTNFLRLSPEH